VLSQNRVFLAIFFRFTNKQSLAWGIVRKTVRHEIRNTVKIVLSLSLESFQHTGQMFTGSHSVICTDRDLHSCFCFFIWVFFFFLLFFRAASMAYGSSQARSWIGATAASLQHSHSNVGSEPSLQPTPQLTAMPDPRPTEQGQESNPHPHGY